jgi:2',5'-phosphodiesterase
MFSWFSEVNGEYVPRGTGSQFTATSLDVGCRMKVKCVGYRDEPSSPSAGGAGAPCRRVLGREVVLYLSGIVSVAPPLPRSVSLRIRDSTSMERSPDAPFRVMTYNILADMYASSDYAVNYLFEYVKEVRFLDQDYRIQLVMNELEITDADIVFLQEVDSKIYQQYLMPILSSPLSDYDCSYSGRYTNKNSGTCEGCATFIRHSAFHTIFELDIPLGYAVLVDHTFRPYLQENKELEEILGRKVGTIAQVTVLQDRFQPSRVIIASNTHFFYHPKANYIRLMHMKVLVDTISELKQLIQRQGVAGLTSYVAPFVCCPEYLGSSLRSETLQWVREPLPHDSSALTVAIVFAGDLNSVPGIAAIEYLEK